LIASGHFSQGNGELFKPLLDKLLYHDPFMLLADYQAYIDCQNLVGQAYGDPDHWTHMAILNSVRMGQFSSDRSIREYCDQIWKVAPFEVNLQGYDGGEDSPENQLTCKLG